MNESLRVPNNLNRKQRLRYGFWLLVGCCCFQACHPAPQKGTSKDDECLAQSLAFEYLTIDAAVNYQDQEGAYGKAYVKFRIKKDYLIWFSVSAPWGLEVLRGIITPTSITLLNHTQKTYYVYDYATLRAFCPGPWDYALLQALLLGECPQAATPHKAVRQNAQTMVVQQKKVGWALTHFINPTLRKVEKLITAAKKGSLVATYSLFKPYQGGLLFRRATLAWYYRTAPMQPNMTLTLKGLRPQWSQEPLPFPFSVPAHYEKKQTMPDW